MLYYINLDYVSYVWYVYWIYPVDHLAGRSPTALVRHTVTNPQLSDSWADSILTGKPKPQARCGVFVVCLGCVFEVSCV